MEIWTFILNHIAAFFAGVMLGAILFRTLWKNAVMHPQSRPISSIHVFRFGFLAIGFYFAAIAVSFGLVLDRFHHGNFSWTAAMLLLGAAAVFLNAWYRIKKGEAPWRKTSKSTGKL